MTIIKRKTFIIKYFARFAEQTDLQKKTDRKSTRLNSSHPSSSRMPSSA